MVRAKGAAALVLWGLCLGFARAEVPVPPLTGPVVDEAGLLNPSESARLEDLARAARAEHGGEGPQLQYVLVRTTEQEPIEDFSIRVAEAWKIGNAARGDGIMVVVAVQDRRARIEVGNGIEGGLTDVQSSRILRSTLSPAFREGRYGQGLYDTGVQILGALGALPQGIVPTAHQHKAVHWPLIAFVLFFSAFSLLRGFFGMFSSGRRMWWGGGPWMGGGLGGFGGGGGGGWSGGGGGFSGGGASGSW